MDIRGHLVSQQELLEASAYASHPQDFGDLLRILDGELRLVTPTDVEAPEPNRAMPPGVEPATYYQLTHDYLVPSLRDWLTRKQRETRRGRAELRLAERAAAYGVRHDARQLPGWREWANILFFTRRRHWTSPEREVMRAAGKRRQLQAMFLAIILLTGALTSHELRHRIDEERDRLQADGLVQRLLTVPLGAVPLVRAELKPYHHLVGERLREVIEEKTKFGDAQRLRASIGLLESDPAQAGPITVAMLNANPDEARVLIAVLKPPTSELTERLRRLLTDAESAPPSRLRAAMALADYSPPGAEERSWLAVAPLVVDQMLIEARQDPSQYEPLVAALAPAADVLLPSLVAVFRDPGRNSTERDLATSVLAKYAASDVKTLVDLISDAQPDQFLTLFPAVEKHRGTAIDHLAIELGKQATPDWHDRPLDPSWRKPAESLLAHIRAADGILAERFALEGRP
jgi:hypothetical protein